jgi:hypothetical protein
MRLVAKSEERDDFDRHSLFICVHYIDRNRLSAGLFKRRLMIGRVEDTSEHPLL